ncbi:MAG TPA: M20/M25/M40 family metallo-hydrolase [Kofleriaceae bacterium]|jgi:acetylornithine deacetylase/succinyl-diaminopimelate desuccinylase-like protein|nr:M20/M25/M40 family metallo-hydrolase [Kofleriaceae bacterium]
MMQRRTFLHGAAVVGAAALLPRRAHAAANLKPIYDQIEKRRAETIARIQEWIKQPTIAAESRGITEGRDLTMRLLRDAGFGKVESVSTDGHPGIFATLDAGAKRTIGLYFMYDVKQVDPKEWSSPPWDAAIVEVPKLGKAIMGRGAVNQKGPQATFLAALHAIRAANRKLPVNLVFVAEGEEEIGSPHFAQVVSRPDIQAQLKKCDGVFMPHACQSNDGTVTINLGAKGVVECEIVSSADTWGRGPKKDIHSSNRARVDSPAWHLVQALSTLVNADGDPAIDGLFERVKPLSERDRKLLDVAARQMNEAESKASLGVQRWAHDANWRQALEDLASKPTVNIEGIYGGYTGPGGMTILPHRAAAKLDLRLVPDMTAADTFAKLKAHLAKRGYGDLDIKMTGGYDPNSTSPDSRLIQSQVKVYQQAGIKPILWPRLAGSWPGYVFTGDPLRQPAGHFGLCHGSRAHAPDEYYLIEPSDPKLHGIDAAVRGFVDYLYELA